MIKQTTQVLTNNNTVVVFTPMNTEIYKKAIELAGTQEKLAAKSGLSQSAISKYIRGVAIPKGSSAQKLSKGVDGLIPPERFLFPEPINHA